MSRITAFPAVFHNFHYFGVTSLPYSLEKIDKVIEIEGKVRGLQVIDERNYYLVQESRTNESHYIPDYQIEQSGFVEINGVYSFIKEYNQHKNRTYLSLIHPHFPPKKKVLLPISRRIERDGKKYFELESDFSEPLTVIAFEWQGELEDVWCQVWGYRRGRPDLKNIDTRNSEWVLDESKYFPILGFGTVTNRNGRSFDSVEVEVRPGVAVSVYASPWQIEDLWKFPNLRCRVVGMTMENKPRLIANDDRHPIFEQSKSYRFTISRFAKKRLSDGKLFPIIKVKDSLEHLHEVQMLPNQDDKLEIGSQILCQVSDIKRKLFLKQVNVDDPFFYAFEEIIEDDELQSRYFRPFLNEENLDNRRLSSQYFQKSAFWVFTYCNTIITSLKRGLRERKAWKDLIELNNLHSDIEKWILNKGILRAIGKEEERKLVKRKIERILQNNHNENFALKELLDFSGLESLRTNLEVPNFQILFYYVRHSDLRNIDQKALLKVIKQWSIPELNEWNINAIRSLSRLVNHHANSLKSSLYQGYFILSQDLSIEESSQLNKYLKWVIIQMKLHELIENKQEINLLLATFYRFYSNAVKDYLNKKKILLNAFYILSDLDNEYEIPVEFIEKDMELSIEHLEENPNDKSLITNKEEIKTAKVIQEHYRGFRLKIEETTGFLPYQNITDSSLKDYSSPLIDWETNIQITLYSEEFNFFIGKQLPKDSEKFYSKNLILDEKPKRGQIIFGTIKDIVHFGLFMITPYGEGLVRINNISYLQPESSSLKKIFQIGDRIPLYLLSYQEGKIEFSLKSLVGTEHEEWLFNTLDSLENDDIEEEIDNEVSNLNYKLEIEKGFIFEQFAVIQNSLEDKVKYLRFAKAFFSNTKNARSYLHNIYIEYFRSLLQLDYLLEDYSFSKYDSFRKEIVEIKEKVQPKTLENYPESKNLLFFIDILYFFNSQKEDDIEVLFNLVRKPIEENDLLLKAVAKNALSNNLIITEIDPQNRIELDEFTKKNLKRIRSYISQGVLSVKEPLEDKLSRELSEKRSYWKNMIDQDEGENLEFKSTFLTPVPNQEKVRILAALEKQLKKTNSEEKLLKIKEKIISLKDDNDTNMKNKLVHSALKTLCAFSNTNGGYLLLGVTDDKKIFGLEQDYNSFKKGKSRDEFGKHFDNVVKDYLGDSFSSTLLQKEFLKYPEGDILIIKVKKSSDEIFLLKNEEAEPEECIYVRNLSSSVKLTGIELSKFFKRRIMSSILGSREE